MPTLKAIKTSIASKLQGPSGKASVKKPFDGGWGTRNAASANTQLVNLLKSELSR